MSGLSYITTGESHGKCLTAIIEGLPSGIPIDVKKVNKELWRRQQGFGRGGRMVIETDTIEITAGLIKGKTSGAPLNLIVTNSDFKIDTMPELYRPRPGHTDLVGSVKYNQGIRAILERSSARETTMRVAVGAIARQLLKTVGIEIISQVLQIGKIESSSEGWTYERIKKATNGSEMNCTDSKVEKNMIAEIKRAIKAKDSVGGMYQVRAKGVPIGLGSHVHYKRKLDGRISQAFMSKQSVKAVAIGLGTEVAGTWGSGTQDPIYYSKTRGFHHKTNRAGGIEGGVTNGEDIVVRVWMKPISTLRKALPSVNLKTRKKEVADFERSDVCAVPAGSVIGESILAFELADALLEKTGGDSLVEVKRNYTNYLKQVKNFRLT
jgi:chorismate synthase